ncbi:MAG: hypothetical protein ACKV2Q_24665, partial [Planctomycetaceae bacterium]
MTKYLAQLAIDVAALVLLVGALKVAVSRDFRSLAIEDEHVVHIQRGDATSTTIAVQEFDFEAIGRKQF